MANLKDLPQSPDANGYASESFDEDEGDTDNESKEQVSDTRKLDVKSIQNTLPTQVPGQSPTGYESEQFDEDEDGGESDGRDVERKASETKSGETSLGILEQDESDNENGVTSQDQEEKSGSLGETEMRKKGRTKRRVVKRSRRRGAPGKCRSASAVRRRVRGQSVPERTTVGTRRKEVGGDYDENEDEEEEYDTEEAYHSGGGGGVQGTTFRTPSAHIMAKKFVERNIVKKKLLDDRTYSRQVILAKKKEQQDEWAAKMRRSPFKIDLVAENERLEEELRIRIKQEERRQKQFERQEQKLKNDVLVQALHQATDLDVLRAEKRMILLEEKRLHALMGVEKTKSSKKNDMMAAMRAEKQRRAQKLEFRRQQRMLAESRYQEAHAHALLEKLGLTDSLT